MKESEIKRRMALWAERKADEAAASAAPWWLGNLRNYQNLANKWWGECFSLEREGR